MSQKMDKRTARTLLAIRDAFMDLLLEQGFEHVTVQAIAARADINRATFYRHYTDKYDLAQRLIEVLFIDVEQMLAQQDEPNAPQSWAILFEHVAQYAPFYRAMLGEGGIPGFRLLVRQAIEAQMMAVLPLDGVTSPVDGLAQTAVIRYLAAAQMGFVEWWLENDMPYTPKDAAAYLLALHAKGGVWSLGLLGN